MGEVVQLDDYRPHYVLEIFCKCGKFWVCVCPVTNDHVECPDCKRKIKINE